MNPAHNYSLMPLQCQNLTLPVWGAPFSRGAILYPAPESKMSQHSSGHAKTSVLQTALLAAMTANKSHRHKANINGMRAAKYLLESLEFQEAWKTSELFID